MKRRTEILRRATEVFVRQGVTGTSIEDIARSVGIKREAIYYYFRSRADILLEIILPQSNALLLGLRSVVRSNQTAAEKLRGAIENHLSSFHPAYLEMSVALREDHFMKDEPKLRELRRVWEEYSRLWTALVREGQERGEFRADFNPKMAAYGILGMCNWLSRWFDPSGDISVDEIIETYFGIITRGILDTAPAAKPKLRRERRKPVPA